MDDGVVDGPRSSSVTVNVTIIRNIAPAFASNLTLPQIKADDQNFRYTVAAIDPNTQVYVISSSCCSDKTCKYLKP